MFQVDLKLIVLLFTSVFRLLILLGLQLADSWAVNVSPFPFSLSLSFTFHWYALDRGDDGLTNWDEEWHWQQEVVTVDNDEWEQRQWTEIQLGRGLRTGITMPMNGDKERHCWNDDSDGGDNGEWGQWTTNRSHRTTDDNEQNDDNEQRRRKAGAVNTTTPPLFFLRVEMWDGFFLSFVLHSWLTLRARARRVVFFLSLTFFITSTINY